MVSDDASGDEEVVIEDDGGLLRGITSYHLRMLTENVMEGGGGFDPRDVAEWSLDQIFFRLCDVELLKKGVGGRTKKIDPSEASAHVKPQPDGTLKGRTADGDVVTKRVGGKSLARQLMEEEEARKAEGKKRRKRRRKRGG